MLLNFLGLDFSTAFCFHEKNTQIQISRQDYSSTVHSQFPILFLPSQWKLRCSTYERWIGILPPDEPFHNFGALQSVAQRF